MRLPFGLMAALAVAIALPALAQDHPGFQPSRDVAVTYHITGAAPAQQRSDTVRMYFTDHGMKMRIEPVGQPAYSIADRTSQHMIVVMVPQHAYMEMPYDPRRVMTFDQDSGASLTRTGSDTVAGIACTVYEVQREGHRGQVCISGDGVLLRAKSDDPSQSNGGMVATSVEYGPQDASLFAPPPGFQKMDMATMGHGGPPGR